MGSFNIVVLNNGIETQIKELDPEPWGPKVFFIDANDNLMRAGFEDYKRLYPEVDIGYQRFHPKVSILEPFSGILRFVYTTENESRFHWPYAEFLTGRMIKFYPNE